jgi:hypothetical protein
MLSERVALSSLYHMRSGFDRESNPWPRRWQGLMLISDIDLTTVPLMKAHDTQAESSSEPLERIWNLSQSSNNEFCMIWKGSKFVQYLQANEIIISNQYLWTDQDWHCLHTLTTYPSSYSVSESENHLIIVKFQALTIINLVTTQT